MAVRDFIRERFFPHIWCPGCGHGTTLNALLHAFDELGLDPCSLVMVSGIGCSARISGYVNVHSMHTLHGRALAFATGITILGVCHYTLTVKGSHLATHSALTESKRWSKILMIFFLEVSLAGWGSCWATLCAHSHGQGAAAEGG